MINEIMDILEEHVNETYSGSIMDTAEEIVQMFCDNVVKIEAYLGHDTSWYLGLRVRVMLKQMGFTEQQIINSLEKLKAK